MASKISPLAGKPAQPRVKPKNFSVKFGSAVNTFPPVFFRAYFPACGDPRPFLTSTDVKNSCWHPNTYKRLAKAMLDNNWDLSEVSPVANRIRIRLDGQVWPAAVSWLELGRLATELNLEQADVTRSVLEISGGKWAIAERITNAEIRAQITAYVNAPGSSLPPPLLADLAEDGSFLLYHSPADGQPVRVNIPYIRTAPKYSFARVVFISPTEIEVGYYKRIMIGFNLSEIRAVRITLKPPTGNAPEVAPGKVAALAPLVESKLIQAWLFDRGKKLDHRVRIIERSVGKQCGAITFTQHQGVPYKLPGLKALYATGIARVKILLGEETVDGLVVKTARIFKIDDDPDKMPEKCLALFELNPKGHSGRLIALNA